MQTFGNFIDGNWDVSSQMVDDLRRRAQTHFRRQEREKAAITTVKQFEAHRARVRRNFMDAIGGLPTKRTLLKARVTGTVEREKFIVEKIIYESVPNFLVTAACYVPKGLTRRTPAVVFVCGHWDAGKSQETYQAVCIDLANNGFIVLAVDPVGQGERSQYFEHGNRVVGSSTLEHTQAGLQFTLQGASIARHFIWDVMRGIDYLESRPDVDPRRIGITGNSGGGTQTCLLMMSEPRIAAAVPCTFVTTLETLLEANLSQDAEQNVRGCFVAGPDHDDYLTAIAPRPVLVGAVAYDFFPIEGSIEAVRRARQIYRLYGKPNHVDLFADNATHAYTPGLRQACVNWFKKHFRGEKPDVKTGNPRTFPESELWATQSGQVAVDFPKSRTAFDLNREHLDGIRHPNWNASRLRRKIDEVLGVSEAGTRRARIFPRILCDTVVNGCRTEKIFLLSAPEIVVTGVMIHPRGAAPNKPLPTVLLLLENGTADITDRRARARIEALLRQGRRVFVFDVRGVGAVKVRSVTAYDVGEYQMFNTEYKLGCDALQLGISTLGLRVFDALRGYDYLKTRRDVGPIHAHGVGDGALFAYYAAALEAGIASVTVENMLYSYRHLCETRLYDQFQFGLKSMAWGILRQFDLVDLLACLRGRTVHFICPRNAFGAAATATEFRDRFLRGAKRAGIFVVAGGRTQVT